MKHPNLAKKPRPPGPASFRDRGGSNRIPDRPRPRTALLESKYLHQSTGDSGLSTAADHQFSGDECIDVVVFVGLNYYLVSSFLFMFILFFCMKTRIRVASGSASIIEAMKSSNGGMTFLEGKSNNLPPYTFISYEAVAWLLEQVEGIATEREAIDLMQKIMNERLICHSSGNKKFVFNFYLLNAIDLYYKYFVA